MSKDLISVIDVANQVGKHKQTVFKVLKRLDIEPQKLRGPDNRGQLASYITHEESRLVITEIKSRKEPKSDSSVATTPESGFFYIIQLEPHHDPGRIKVGFASNMSERLRKHRCAAPYAKVLKKWRCRSLWEKTAIDCVCNGCKRLHTEVFETNSIDAVIEKCDEFFKLMPPL